MKRRLLIIVVCLLLGAVVNVAVAWGCAVLSPPDVKWFPGTLLTRPTAVLHRTYTVLGPIEGPFWVPKPEAGEMWNIHEWGLPLVAMRSKREVPTISLGSQVSVGYVATVSPPVRYRDPSPPPLQPVWLGFSVNTLLYAGILWLLGPFAFRRFLRVRRGLCPKCAYPMGESSVCTECGGALAKGRVA